MTVPRVAIKLSRALTDLRLRGAINQRNHRNNFNERTESTVPTVARDKRSHEINGLNGINDFNETNGRTEQTRQTKRTALKITRFEDLDCWQAARKPPCGGSFSLPEKRAWVAAGFSLRSSLCHCEFAGGRRGNLGFFFIATASAAEVQSHLYIALDQGYITKDVFDEIYDQVKKTAMIISGFIRYLRTRPTRPTKSTR